MTTVVDDTTAIMIGVESEDEGFGVTCGDGNTVSGNTSSVRISSSSTLFCRFLVALMFAISVHETVHSQSTCEKKMPK